VQIPRQEVVDVLRRTGFADLADDAARILPDPADTDEVEKFLAPHGITVDRLISEMGGSP
jgi:hypothetical protein